MHFKTICTHTSARIHRVLLLPETEIVLPMNMSAKFQVYHVNVPITGIAQLTGLVGEHSIKSK
jgi:hypothetical protein